MAGTAFHTHLEKTEGNWIDLGMRGASDHQETQRVITRNVEGVYALPAPECQWCGKKMLPMVRITRTDAIFWMIPLFSGRIMIVYP